MANFLIILFLDLREPAAHIHRKHSHFLTRSDSQRLRKSITTLSEPCRTVRRPVAIRPLYVSTSHSMYMRAIYETKIKNYPEFFCPIYGYYRHPRSSL